MDASDNTPGEGESSNGCTDGEKEFVGGRVPIRDKARLAVLVHERTEFRDRVSQTDLLKEALREYLDRRDDEIPEEQVQKWIQYEEKSQNTESSQDRSDQSETADAPENVGSPNDEPEEQEESDVSPGVREEIDKIRDAREDHDE
jgi:hypothetical protein